MHSPETKTEFIKLRAHGWSISRASKHLNVSKSTLLRWNAEHLKTIRCLRAVELEEFHESLLSSHKAQVDQLEARRQLVAAEITKRGLADVATDKLFQVEALLRTEIQKLRDAAAPILKTCPYLAPLPEESNLETSTLCPTPPSK